MTTNQFEELQEKVAKLETVILLQQETIDRLTQLAGDTLQNVESVVETQELIHGILSEYIHAAESDPTVKYRMMKKRILNQEKDE